MNKNIKNFHKLLCGYLIAWQFIFILSAFLSSSSYNYYNRNHSPLTFIESSDVNFSIINLPSKSKDTNNRSILTFIGFNLDFTVESKITCSKLKSIVYNNEFSLPAHLSAHPNKYSFRGPPSFLS